MKTSLSKNDFARIKVIHEFFERGFYFTASMAMHALESAGIKISLRSTEKFLTKLSGGSRGERIQLLTTESSESYIEKTEGRQFKSGIRLVKPEKMYTFSNDDRNRFFDTYGEL
jgi:D-alanine-D-alanine ligase-like ATP-grasp enzyme